jgi:GntR family transcriptional regulator/MocR family aminotransferase
LSADLGVSRNTVLQAIEQLVAEGYAEARGGSGTFVLDSLPRTHRPRPDPDARTRGRRTRLSKLGQRIARASPRGATTWHLPRAPVDIDFRYGEPAYADLPLDAWSRILARRARRLSLRRLAYQTPGGAPELREALAPYLARARGVVCDPDQIIITQGSQQAIDLSTRLLIDPGDTAVLEEPHYTGFSLSLAAAGARIVYVPTDEEGLRVDKLERIDSARMLCVTPSHQFPAGGVLPASRRLELLDWARRRAATVLEDDYDGEFRFNGRPLACLQSLDASESVVYVGTASKVLFPALRIGWLVAPPGLADGYRSIKAITDTGTATLEQLAFADFISGGHLERHVRRSRRRHALRRKALLEATEHELGDRAEVVGTDAGIHVLLRVPELPSSQVRPLRAACRERGVGVYPASPFYARPPKHAELLLGYAALCEDEIRLGIRRVAAALDSLAL